MPVWMASSLFHCDSTLPGARSRVPIALEPPTYSTIRICDGDSQLNVLGDDGLPGVRLVASPPAAGTVSTSPPVEPWSLMIPPMKPIIEPSGDHRGSAICSAGLWITVAAPVSAGIVYSFAVHQLLSPGPGAALSAKVLPSGDQSYS